MWCQSFFIVLTASYAISGRIPNMTRNEVCHDDQCRQAAKVILDGLDESVDPCRDFYRYACGKRKTENHQAPIHRLHPNHDPQILSSVREILEAPSKLEDSHALQIEKQLYRTCIDADQDIHSVKHLRNILQSTDGLKVALPESNRKFNKTWQEVDMIYSKMGFGHALFDVQVISDPEKTGRNIIALQPPPNSSDILNDIQDLCASDRKLLYVLSRFGLEDDHYDKDKRFGKTLQFVASLKQLISECWAITVKPVRAKIHTREWQKAYDGVDRKKDTAHINWLDTLKSLFHEVQIELNDSELIHIEKKEYFNRLSKMLEETDADTITTFVHLRFLAQVLQHLKHFTSGNERWMECVLSNDKIGVSQEYVKKYLLEDRRMTATPIVKEILNYIITQISDTWDDKESKTIELKKLEDMRMIVGYQDWVVNDTYISNYYGDFKPEPESHLDNMINYQPIAMKHNLVGLRNLKEYQPKKRICDNLGNCFETSSSFIFNVLPLGVIAANEHEIIFPAEYFNNKSYSFLGSKLPIAVNYGGYGSEMSRLMHAHPAFRDKHIKKYEDDQQTCFSKQLANAVKVTKTDELDLYLKRKSLRVAFDIFNKLNNTTSGLPKLHGLEKFSDDQLFFLTFAAGICASNQYVGQLPISINISVSNMAEFSTAFQCPESSAMNRKDKCV